MAKFAYYTKCIVQQLQQSKWLLFINLVIIYLTLTVSIAKAHSDKWDENVRPKLVFDFLQDLSSTVMEEEKEDPNQSKAFFFLDDVVLSANFVQSYAI